MRGSKLKTMSRSREYKNAIYEQLARLGKALSSGPRLELLDLLCQGPRTVDSLAREADQSTANTSHHLQVLRRDRLVTAEKRGVTVTYSLADGEVCAFYQSLRRLAESRIMEIEEVTHKFLEDRGAMEPVILEKLLSLVENGEVTVLDVRPVEEYRAGHIPGALSIPLDELTRRISELPRNREIVAYCRGPYCVLALEAVDVLKQNGIHAARLREGVLDWKTRGLTLEVDTKS
jgi:rhodanese-related sulfurtransferase